ncbi:NAD(P)/FAD-dependent oxidoreductase [Granulicella mallensis]|uniref:Pyruvate/2-oxoglutarate dehydrogenase complex dihydrolipoamide dehydrogenase (E3) component n=1 Tax=Granulicella mallensis TaxID=940614 RepID=A0A7W8E9S1_9BACT|nr:FAD-dependent oxidoreductase [Granulicella mallensis]MBB5064773.1 pyruvate/2-oxoglutarate dehydrogenase complex dihydrolipoamide dehydrogenase (E3) component [Granulicella mallensis]
MDLQAQPEVYDLLILGSGAGAKLLAWTFAGQGQRVAVVERKYVGGACPNIACLPSKNVIHTAQIAHNVRRSDEFGVSVDNFRVNMPAVRDRKRRMVQGLVDTHLALYKQSGAELIMASGRFVEPRILEATLADGTKRLLTGKNIVIGTGTHAAIENIPGMAVAQPLTHVEALELDVVPEHLIILGAGYVGLEFAQAMRRFGSQVTVVDRNERVIHGEDEDTTEGLQSLLEDEGIKLVLNAKLKSIAGVSGKSVRVTLSQNGTEKLLEGTHLLVAAGRVPNTKDIGLDLVGVELTERGYIKVNERLETTAPGVWAVGEVAGSPQFTHISEDDFRVVRDNLLGGNHVTTGRQVPFCLFTDPEFARIGMNEKEARARGIAYRLFKVPMTHVLRARSLMETRGFLKCLVERDSDRILGFAAFGVGAGEIMGCVQIAMLGGMPYTLLREAILAHPTIPEGLIALFSSAAS